MYIFWRESRSMEIIRFFISPLEHVCCAPYHFLLWFHFFILVVVVGRPVVIVTSAKKFWNYFGALELWRTPLASIFIFFGWASSLRRRFRSILFFFLSPTISTRWCADRKQDRKWNLEEEEEECWRQKSKKENWEEEKRPIGTPFKNV